MKDVYGVNHPMALECQGLLASMHESLGHRKPAIDVRLGMLRDALWGRDDDDQDDSSLGNGRNLDIYLHQLRSLRCGYAVAAANTNINENEVEDEDYALHLEQNVDCLEEIMGKVRKLAADNSNSPDTGNVLDIEMWKSFENLDVGQDALDVWGPPKDWAVDMEVEGGEEEQGDEGAWSVTDGSVF